MYFGILSAQQFITSQHTYTTTTILVPHISTKSQQPDLLVFRAVGEEEREREKSESGNGRDSAFEGDTC